MKKPIQTAARAKAPVLEYSPFEAVEVVDAHDLAKEDRAYLQEREKTIDAGRRTFLEVGQALIEIRDYRDGLLYKRYGTFEKYCQERWEFGRSYAFRLMDAAEIYQEMLPRGNTDGEVASMLPTTEKQIRSLKKLPTAELRFDAWSRAVQAAGERPVFARDVEREVRKLMADEKSAPAGKTKPRRSVAVASYQIDAKELQAIHAQLALLKRWSTKAEDGKKIGRALARIEELLPG